MKPKIMKDSWYNQLEFIFKSSQFSSLMTYLKSQGEICPKPADIFKAFSYFDFADTRVVMIFLSPYQTARPDGKLYATGLATAIPDNQYDRESLSLLRQALDVDYPSELDFDNTLENWAKQGILLLNPALTVPLNGNPKAHLEKWKPITTTILQVLSSTLSGLIFVPFGTEARNICKVVNRANHHVIDGIPRPAAYSWAKSKYGNIENIPDHLDVTKSGVFRKIDEILFNLNKEKINWYVS
jgi:uracil-DNA glycosylase